VTPIHNQHQNQTVTLASAVVAVVTGGTAAIVLIGDTLQMAG
jgi:high-affinity nickel permease